MVRLAVHRVGDDDFRAALIALVIRELTTENPVVDLHLFKDRNFAISTFMMYTLGFVLYSTTLLLPILMQTLMGYTAMESGLVLLPGGLVLLGILPFVGILLGRFQPRWIVITGLVVMATGLFQLSHLNLYAERALDGFRLGHLADGHGVFVRADQRDGVLFRAARER